MFILRYLRLVAGLCTLIQNVQHTFTLLSKPAQFRIMISRCLNGDRLFFYLYMFICVFLCFLLTKKMY